MRLVQNIAVFAIFKLFANIRLGAINSRWVSISYAAHVIVN